MVAAPAGAGSVAGSKGGLAAAVVRRRGWIAVAWIAAGAVLLPAAGRVERTLDVAARIGGSESAMVEQELVRRFASPFAKFAVLVATGVPGPGTPDGRAALEQVVAGLGTVPGLTQCLSYLDGQDTLFQASTGDGTFVVCGLDPRRQPADALISDLRAATTTLAVRLSPQYARLALRWTGDVALNFDLRRTSAAQAHGAERRTLPLTLLLLVWAFGAVAAALLPTVVGMLAISLTLGVAVIISARWPLSILLQNVVTMLGLGLGIDYALLMVSRFREARAAGAGATQAAEVAARQAGHTIALSGVAVSIGFAALLLVPLNELRSVAVGGLVVVTVSVLLATTLLPGLLAWLGPRVDLGHVPRGPGRARAERWRRWGRWVTQRPGTVLALAGAPVALLAWQATRLDTGLPRGDWLPPAMESARAVHDLQRMGRGAVIQAVRIVLELPDGVTAGSRQGWEATRRLSDGLAADPRVARVRSLPASAGGKWRPSALAFLRQDVRRTFISDDRRVALLDVVPRESASAGELIQLVRALRARDAVALTGLRGTAVRVGGLPAFNADYEDAVGGRFPGVVALVVAGTLVALCAGFGSVLIPVKAVLLNLVSVAAAFGAVVLVFQDGFGARLFGLSGPLSGVFPVVPILVFCTVFGLSMDYEVFLVARVAEARRAGLAEGDALAEGLARTAGVITSAAAIMIVVFAAFTLGDFLLIKMLGFALAVAVLLDATVVRLAIGPALLRLAGRWNWWPGGSVASGRRPLLQFPAMSHRSLPLALLLALDPGDGAHPGPLGDAAGARIFTDLGRSALVIDLAPLDLPANTPHHELAQPPVAMLEIPADGSIHGFRVEVVDSAGRELPDELIHHFNLIDPDHRELFLPISRRLLAAGRETGPVRLPGLLFGLPLKRGEHVVASGMVENLTSATYRQARVRLVMDFTPAGRPWPLFRASPWQMDVAFPVGDKSFTLPPGRSSRTYEGSPAVPGKIVGLGGHMHDYGRLIEFVDATTGEVIYHAAPVGDSAGHIASVPVSRLYGWTGLGVHITPDHKYRVSVYYDNPTGQSIPDGGMGVVGGLFVPDRGVAWPAADRTDSLYQQDYRHYMRLVGGHEMPLRMLMPMSAHVGAHEHGAAHAHREKPTP